ncbi:ParB family chromosome partitioning protein [Streptomyces sp. SAI-135]|uniref:ParB/RepB/Spo0J family partition protein n=1 Tax=unclassified Streptomyces TaxID=2593676 RepID=UPI0024761D44|nr:MULTISPECIES: ParB/RepB/Spo0J family partition protein [unclassified Streptomyces]MDH6522691.1 ParB family chromosome partitioning protein [Streptomyces sp. SAI-090]MDH6554312.1 ParB family chromosome partitioning protein [Streptomyces sp. SAI-041]MDH6573576.1 ParB family chromosome partitioning protein [Streptomyces sp. SAI-117]MDH6581689.1 ParB family chromosome partitioning protein [Streptomyces sp. SAI-133]MDH6613693.1 ParB family chromosome partitioning protein [Streptomyces sp. SAI-13
MSKADQLGAGRFGGGVRPVSARRQAVAAATGVPTEGIAPPTELPVHRISLNPDNPRTSLGDLTDLAGSLKTHGQKQAITVMNRDAYLKANPGQEADLEPDTTHVVVDGSSRLAAAREGGLATIKVMVSDEQGSTPEELLESALVANIHRQDLEELDEARALQRLLDIHGSQRALAKHLHRSQGWVSQRLALLNLTPELQARIGKEPIDLLRAVGNKPADQQQAALEELKADRARKDEETRARPKAQPTSNAGEATTQTRQESDYGVITRAAEEPGAVGIDEAVNADGSAAAGESSATPELSPELELSPEPEPPSEPAATAEQDLSAGQADSATPSVPAQVVQDSGTAQAADRLPKKFPYDDGHFAAQLLIHKMPPDEFNRMLDQLIKHRDAQQAAT